MKILYIIIIIFNNSQIPKYAISCRGLAYDFQPTIFHPVSLQGGPTMIWTSIPSSPGSWPTTTQKNSISLYLETLETSQRLEILLFLRLVFF